LTQPLIVQTEKLSVHSACVQNM